MLAGALPACALSLARIQEPAGSKGSAAGSEDAPSPAAAAPPSSLYLLAGQLRHGTVRAYLLGSCLSWFFSDILLCRLPASASIECRRAVAFTVHVYVCMYVCMCGA